MIFYPYLICVHILYILLCTPVCVWSVDPLVLDANRWSESDRTNVPVTGEKCHGFTVNGPCIFSFLSQTEPDTMLPRSD